MMEEVGINSQIYSRSGGYQGLAFAIPINVAVGGGTGLSSLLKGLKRYSSRITAIVTVADDGGRVRAYAFKNIV